MLVEDVEEAYRPAKLCRQRWWFPNSEITAFQEWLQLHMVILAEKEIHLPVLGREDRGAQWMGHPAPCRAMMSQSVSLLMSPPNSTMKMLYSMRVWSYYL